MIDMSGWMLATVLGPLVIAAVFIYVLLTRRRLSATEKRRQVEETRHVYDQADAAERRGGNA